MAKAAAMHRINADDVNAQIRNVVDDASTHDFTRQTGTRQCVWPGVRNFAFAHPAGAITDTGLQGRRACAAGGLRDTHPVTAQGLNRDAGEIGHHVGRGVGGRVEYFVKQLFLHRARVDQPAGAGHFADHRCAVV